MQHCKSNYLPIKIRLKISKQKKSKSCTQTRSLTFRWILCQLWTTRNIRILERVAYPFLSGSFQPGIKLGLLNCRCIYQHNLLEKPYYMPIKISKNKNKQQKSNYTFWDTFEYAIICHKPDLLSILASMVIILIVKQHCCLF